MIISIFEQSIKITCTQNLNVYDIYSILNYIATRNGITVTHNITGNTIVIKSHSKAILYEILYNITFQFSEIFIQ